MNAVARMSHVAVEVDGAPLPIADARSLSEVRVRQRLLVPTACVLTFVTPSADLAAGRVLAVGARLRVTVTDHADALFDGEVTAIEHRLGPSGPHEVQVRGYDRLHRLRKRQPVRGHVHATVAGLAREMLSGEGVTVESDVADPQWEKVFQHRQTDFDLLVEMAQRSGAYFTLHDNVLRIMSLQGTGMPIQLSMGEELLEARMEVNADATCRSAKATGWDPARVEPHTGRATQARVGRATGVGTSLPSAWSTGERILAGEVVQDDRQADAVAQAELDYRAAQEVVFEGMAEGDPRLRPGSRVQLRGVPTAFVGEYTLTSVTHALDADRGFISELSTVPPTCGGPRPRGTLIALGRVSHVDDPENLGRVQVTLPAYDGLETGWMGVLTAGAGKDKGLIAIPDVGDRVLVLCAKEDPAQGVVLGGLYGADCPPDGGVENGAVKRYTLVTPGGQRIRLDDTRKAIRLEISSGSYVDLSPEKLELHSASELVVEAPGKAIVIRGLTVDFEQAKE
jgi:phage baseplate assembly protein V